MRQRRIVTLATTLFLTTAGAVGLIAQPASAALVTSCTGTASGVTVPNDLVVPAGKSCELTDVTINGATTVRAGGNLLITHSTLNGPLTVQADGFTDLDTTTVTGAVKLNSAFGAYAENSTLGANVTATSAGFFYGVKSSLTGVSSTDGETYLESARVSKNLATSGDVLTDVYNSVIDGTVDITGAQTGSVMCVSEVDGNATFENSGSAAGSVLQIGASAPLAGCGFNVFGANLALNANTAQVYVSDNVVRGSLTCADNAAAPIGSSSRLRGDANGQCAAPSASMTGMAARSAAPAKSAGRDADVLARSKARAGAGSAAAAAAGPSGIGH